MRVPNYINDRIVTPEGKLVEEWQVVISQLLEELQINFSNEGLVPPSQSVGNIAIIADGAKSGTLIFDEANNQLLVRLNDGTFHPIMTS